MALAAISGTSPAHALSDEQMAALSHVAQVFAGAKICSQVELNATNLAVLYIAYEINLDDPLQFALVKSKVDDTESAFAGKDSDGSCLAVMLLYGPNGANVPDLLKWK